jgi:hypothetical protein
LLVLIVQTVGCDSGGPIRGNLDRSGAAVLIKKNFKADPGLMLTVDKKPFSPCRYLRENGSGQLLLLERMGLVSLVTMQGGGIINDGNCASQLTEEGRRLRWKETDRGWEIPIGNKELVEVTGILGADQSIAEAEFTWRLAPNSMGQKVLSLPYNPGNRDYWYTAIRSPTVQRGKAGFQKYDDGWRLVQIE